MEPKFNTSFIPKKPIEVAPGPAPRRAVSGNIFNTIATIVFILTLAAAGGLYVYRNIITGQISQADKDLNDARAAFETDKIQNILDTNARISAIKGLLENHITVSELLVLLQTLTVKRVRLTGLTYENNNSVPEVTLNVEASTYNALAEQSDFFEKNEFIKNQQFSNFGLSDNGNIKSKFSATLDPTLISYKKAIESLSINQ